MGYSLILFRCFVRWYLCRLFAVTYVIAYFLNFFIIDISRLYSVFAVQFLTQDAKLQYLSINFEVNILSLKIH